MSRSWYERTKLKTYDAIDKVTRLLPERISALEDEIASGMLGRAKGMRKIALEKAWITRITRWLNGYRGARSAVVIR